MMQVPCEQCGLVLEVPETFAGQKGRCKRCGHAFTVPPEPVGQAPEGAVAPAHFGAYGKAADAHWDDPAGQALRSHEAPANLGDAGIPLGVLEKHRARVRARMQRYVLFSLAVATLIGVCLAVGLLVMGLRGGPAVTGEPAAALPDTPPADAAASAVRETGAPPREDGGGVYVVAGDTRYHRGQCAVGPSEVGGRQRLEPGQALAAGYAPCRECRPLGYENYYHVPLYERIGTPASSVADAPARTAPLPTVYMNAGETVVHMADCALLSGDRQLITVVDAHARGYTACPKCLPE